MAEGKLDYKLVKIDVDRLLINHHSVLFGEFLNKNSDLIEV